VSAIILIVDKTEGASLIARGRGFCSEIRRGLAQSFLRLPFCGRCTSKTADSGAADHVPPVDQIEINESFRQGVSDALLGPSVEGHVGRIPFVVALMHFCCGQVARSIKAYH
jgi:hypothetical protein